MPPSFESFDFVSHGVRALPPPKYVNAYVLAPGVAKTFAIPAVNGQAPTYALFSWSAGNVAFGYTPSGSADVVASMPVTDVTDGSACEVDPNFRSLIGYSKLSAISDANCILTVAYYQL